MMLTENYDRERLLELSALSCDETLSSAEFAELEQILLENAAAREAFRDYTSVHVTLASCFGAGAVAEAPGKVLEITEAEVVRMWPRAAVAIAAAVVLGLGAYFLIPREGSAGPARIAREGAGKSAGSGAAAEGLPATTTAAAAATDAAKELGMVGTPVIESRKEGSKEPGAGATKAGGKRPTAQRVPPRPGLIAQVAALTAAGWAESSAHPKVNDWLGASTLKLEKGLVRIVFAEGASVTLRGPAEIDLLSGNAARLDSGQLVARVPERAAGFTVRTDSVNVVDLGTAFGMNADEEGEVEVQVFQGEVELISPESAPGGVAKPKRVRTGQGYRATIAKASPKGGGQPKKKVTLEAVKANAAPYERLVSYNSGVVKTSGPVKFVEGTPSQVIGKYEHNKNLFVFREQAGVWLEEPVEVDVVAPGNYRALDGRTTTTAAGVAVRSYLLHFNPVGQLEKPGRAVKAAITFDEPVVGIILNNERLKGTDARFAIDVSKYRTSGRSMDAPAEEAVNRAKADDQIGDRVILSGDRKTVRVDWKASASMDEVRVLVRDEE